MPLVGTLGDQSKGELYVYDTEGCAVNHATNSCSPNAQSAIRFNAGSNSTFFPNSITQVDLPDGSRRILVGGAAMTNANGVVSRKAGLGVITLGPEESLKSKLQNTSGAEGCNISNCKWNSVNVSTDNAEFMDTAHVAVDPIATNQIYVAPMTKSSGKDSQANLYKGTWNGNDYVFSKFASVAGTEEGKIVTAISDRPIRVNNQTYLAVCLSKNMSSSCGGECLPKTSPPSTSASPTLTDDKVLVPTEDDKGEGAVQVSEAEMYGEIQLVAEGNNVASPGFVLKRHNYLCSSINVDDNQNLIVAGRLTAQPVSIQEIKEVIHKGVRRAPSAITAASTSSEISAANVEASKTPMLYLDEIIAQQHGQNYYADYYQVDPETYEDATNPQYIGWLTGMSTVEFPDGTFGMVNANKYRLDANFGINNTASPKEYSNAGISKVRLGGMSDRVVATIQTDPTNINSSVITAVYSARAHDLPSVYIQGKFFAAPGRQRTSPTPLPALTPALNEKSWLELYQALLTPRSETLNSSMPILGSSLVPVTDCQNTKPKTCD